MLFMDSDCHPMRVISIVLFVVIKRFLNYSVNRLYYEPVNRQAIEFQLSKENSCLDGKDEKLR